MPAHQPVRLTRAQPIEFELPTGESVVVAPPTVRQLREAVALDPPQPDDGSEWMAETPDQAMARHVAQAKILCGVPTTDAGTWIDDLDHEALSQVLVALIAHAHGYDPQANVSLVELLKKKALIDRMHSASSTP